MNLNNLEISMLAKISDDTWRVVVNTPKGKIVSDKSTLEECFEQINSILKFKLHKGDILTVHANDFHVIWTNGSDALISTNPNIGIGVTNDTIRYNRRS